MNGFGKRLRSCGALLALVARHVWTYDAASGHVLSSTGPTGVQTTLGYDADGRNDRVTDSSGHSWHAVYDGEGNLTSMTNPRGGSFTLAQNGEGQ